MHCHNLMPLFENKYCSFLGKATSSVAEVVFKNMATKPLLVVVLRYPRQDTCTVIICVYSEADIIKLLPYFTPSMLHDHFFFFLLGGDPPTPHLVPVGVLQTAFVCRRPDGVCYYVYLIATILFCDLAQ
jgi:hypothetical protein